MNTFMELVEFITSNKVKHRSSMSIKVVSEFSALRPHVGIPLLDLIEKSYSTSKLHFASILKQIFAIHPLELRLKRIHSQ